MRNTSSRSVLVLVLTLAFFAGLVYHTVNLISHAAEWSSMPTNAYISDSGGLAYAGEIRDRNGVVLARTKDKKRIYNDDEEIRRACLHVVGDDSTNISTAVQTAYRSELTNYNFVFGLGLPESMKSGKDIVLTIDSELQRAALEALGSTKGAILFYNYKTGEILCMVSTPTYDPENVPEDINTNSAYEGAYLNRTISAAYPPGSTFKLVTSAAAMNEVSDFKTRTYNCVGHDTIGGEEVTCFEVNGTVNYKDALCRSCNVFFAQLALDVGRKKMTRYAENLGFNSSIKFDGIETAKSVYDVSSASDNDLAWSGVGQYTVLETPLNMAMISAAIANEGVPVMPYFISSIGGVSKNSTTLGSRMMSKETADTLCDMMEYTVNNNYRYYGRFLNHDVCAKTGTAEIGNNEAHAWVTGFCRSENYPLAFAVVVEKGNSGINVAIPTAERVLDKAAEIYNTKKVG